MSQRLTELEKDDLASTSGFSRTRYRPSSIISHHSSPVELDVVGGEETLLAAELTEPPVFIGELKVGDLVILVEAQFCSCVSIAS